MKKNPTAQELAVEWLTAASKTDSESLAQERILFGLDYIRSMDDLEAVKAQLSEVRRKQSQFVFCTNCYNEGCDMCEEDRS